MSIATDDNCELLTASDFRRRYNVGLTKFYELLNSGALPALKSGTRTMIRKSDADAWVKSLPAYEPAA